MTTILQISDTHIAPKGTLVSGKLDTADTLVRLVARVTSIRDHIGPIDAVLVSGDLSDDGSRESYARFKALIAKLDLPLHVIPGNHDAREPMRAAFPETLPARGPLNWSRKVGEITMVGLDTLIEGQGAGALTPATLTFLQDALTRAKGTPMLVALHHPPFLSDIRFMDQIGLTNRDAFRDIVAEYAGDLRIICGHVHSMMVTTVAQHVAISAPSPCSTFAFDRRAEASKGFMSLEDGCLLHRWNGGFQTIRIGPVAGAGPFAF